MLNNKMRNTNYQDYVGEEGFFPRGNMLKTSGSYLIGCQLNPTNFSSGAIPMTQGFISFNSFGNCLVPHKSFGEFQNHTMFEEGRRRGKAFISKRILESLKGGTWRKFVAQVLQVTNVYEDAILFMRNGNGFSKEVTSRYFRNYANQDAERILQKMEEEDRPIVCATGKNKSERLRFLRFRYRDFDYILGVKLKDRCDDENGFTIWKYFSDIWSSKGFYVGTFM